jgi:GcrA cell cycle regulator
LTFISEYQKLWRRRAATTLLEQSMELANWAPEHAAALREYLAQGLTYSQIARAINAKFNTTYSRCAVIGRARRMGLAIIDRPTDWTKPLPNAQQPSLHKLRERHAVASRWFVPEFEQVKMPKLRCVEIDPRHLSLLHLENGDCRYPYGGDEEGQAITFCGHPCREESSYCMAHFHLTRGPGADPERVPATASLRVVEIA